MNAHIRHKVDKATKNQIKGLVRDEMQKQGLEMSRRYLKLFAYILNEHFGFGAGRLSKIVDCFNELNEEKNGDAVFWQHLDKRLHDIGVPFDKENYEDLGE